MTNRCDWAGDDPLMIAYHDHEWGVPVHDDRRFFEFLILEGAQAGLNWLTVLRKRSGYQAAFEDFDPATVAAYDEDRIQELLNNPEIIRNRLKIRSAVSNARAFLEVQGEFGSFDDYIWQFAGGKPLQNRWESLSQLPAETPESNAMSKALKKRGFRFVGPTICYAFMHKNGHVYKPISSL
ncbi:MAG: DNA-3-methyladenine glycosylase I [Anaerolineales bacterium]|nr:DNA-3-methyladenine glycosylase I [Anaerolineales bacterium]